MSFFDDLKQKAEDSLNNVTGDIKTLLENRISDAVVKVGEHPKGNLTAAQIAAGQTGASSQALVPPQAASYAKFLPLVIVAVGAYFIFSHKGK